MSKWEASTAGGSLNTSKFDINPQFKVAITGAGPQLLYVKVEIIGADYSVGVHLFSSGQRAYHRASEGMFVADLLASTLHVSVTCIERHERLTKMRPVAATVAADKHNFLGGVFVCVTVRKQQTAVYCVLTLAMVRCLPSDVLVEHLEGHAGT